MAKRLPLTPAPDQLNNEQKRRVVRWVRRLAFEDKILPASYTKKTFLRREMETCLAHHGAQGNLKADWARAVMQWILKTHEFHRGVKPRQMYRNETPQEPREAGKRQLEMLADVLALEHIKRTTKE